MRRFARVYCGKSVYEREIDNQGRMILGHIGNIKSISRTLRRKVNDENDIKNLFRLITLEPVERIEFFDTPE